MEENGNNNCNYSEPVKPEVKTCKEDLFVIRIKKRHVKIALLLTGAFFLGSCATGMHGMSMSRRGGFGMQRAICSPGLSRTTQSSEIQIYPNQEFRVTVPPTQNSTRESSNGNYFYFNESGDSKASQAEKIKEFKNDMKRSFRGR